MGMSQQAIGSFRPFERKLNHDPAPPLPPPAKQPAPQAPPAQFGDHLLKKSPKLEFEFLNGELQGAHPYRGPIKV